MKQKKSLRELAKEMGVSASYLSQVKHGKRPASQKVLSILGQNVKQNVRHKVDVEALTSYNQAKCQCSSGVEQRFRKPPVVGSNPTAGSIPD
jgi:transcriptional regulator with XRE-family HTH domain